MRRVHLIGGPHDGRKLEIDPGVSSVRLPSRVPHAAMSFDGGIAFTVEDGRFADYRPERFLGKRTFDADGAERWGYSG